MKPATAQTAKTTANSPKPAAAQPAVQKLAVQPAKATTTAARSVTPVTYAATQATSSLPKYKPTVNSSINDYIRKIILKHQLTSKIFRLIFQNIIIAMANLKVL